MNIVYTMQDMDTGEKVKAIQYPFSTPLPEEFSSMGYLEHENGYDLEVNTPDGQGLCRQGDFIVKSGGNFYVYSKKELEQYFSLVNKQEV